MTMRNVFLDADGTLLSALRCELAVRGLVLRESRT